MKYVVIFIAIVLVAGGGLFAKKHRAQSIKNHLPPVEVKDLAPMPFAMQPSNFSDQVDLWGQPWIKPEVADSELAVLGDHRDFRPVNFEDFHSRLAYQAEPVVTVEDRQVVMSLFELGGFRLRLNMKPGYASPEALFPTSINPGLSGSFSF